MPQIDIAISPDLQEMFDLPSCEDIALPPPSVPKLHLPTGGSLTALTDVSKGIPTDCAMTFNLLLQLAPFLAATECLFKVLKLLKPLIDVINGLPMPPVKAIQEFAKAAADLAPCLLVPTPANMLPFIRDILCLVLKILNCLLGQMKTLLAMMKGLTLQLQTAQTAGNDELAGTIQCAMENAQTSAKHMTKAIEPIGIILSLVEPLMSIAGVKPIKLPGFGDSADVDALQESIKALQGVVGTIKAVVDALGGCPE